MNRIQHDSDAAPAGFAWVRTDWNARMLLPATLAEIRTQENLRRVAEEQARALQELRQGNEKAAPSAQRVKHWNVRRKTVRAAPKPGWHRVLPKLATVAKELDDPNAVERTADKEINQHRRRVLERLLALGPDRRIAAPVQWRAAVDDLEASLPHFHAPIRALRHALSLAEATGTAPRIPPQLLLGPPGVGKTFYSHRVAELFGSAHASIHFDQPTAGSQLRGSDKYWGNTEPGVLFNLICLGEFANPVILLDEMDKACAATTSREINPLAQLHSALERETAERLLDISVDLDFDASLAVYIGTANSLRGLDGPILSRMQLFVIQPPSKWEAIDLATNISAMVLRRLGLEGQVSFERPALYLLAHLSPRQMIRAAEQSIGAAVAAGRPTISEADLWRELGDATDSPLH